jgi:hypothetical protein
MKSNDILMWVLLIGGGIAVWWYLTKGTATAAVTAATTSTTTAPVTTTTTTAPPVTTVSSPVSVSVAPTPVGSPLTCAQQGLVPNPNYAAWLASVQASAAAGGPQSEIAMSPCM